MAWTTPWLKYTALSSRAIPCRLRGVIPNASKHGRVFVMKKIAVCGKGGSGKSVVTTLLAFALRDRGMRVLVVDSDDSNPGLHRMLGFQEVPDPLIEFMGGKGKVENDIQARIRSGVPEPMVNLLPKAIAVKD